MSKSKSKVSRAEDIWTLVENEPQDIDISDLDTSLLMVGDSACGKTSLIHSFLKSSTTKTPKPTFALDYSFARKKNAATSKSVAHIWELGGDIYEPGLLDIPISSRTIRSLSVMVCCDLSKPHNLLQSLMKWLRLVQGAVSRRIKELGSEGAAQMREAARAPFAGHVDERCVSPCEVPLYIICNKYDIFKDLKSVDKRAALQVLRFVAHNYGATLLFTSTVEAPLRESFKLFMNSVAFRSGLRQAAETQHDKPIYVSAGKDSFESILLGHKSADGAPESHSSPTKNSKYENDISAFVAPDGVTRECWKRLAEFLEATFELPPDVDLSATDAENAEQAAEDEHPEPEIDEMRAQRDDVLRRYIQETERKEAMQARMNAQLYGDASGAAEEDDEEAKVTEKSSRRSKK